MRKRRSRKRHQKRQSVHVGPGRIIVRRERHDPINIDLLTQAIIQIAEQHLLQQQAEDFARSLAEDEESAA
jgi:hypothetical protein